MNKIYLLLISIILLTGCNWNWDNQCRCIETTTDFQYNRVLVDEYTIEGCNEPFTQTTVYRWGNIVTDCR